MATGTCVAVVDVPVVVGSGDRTARRRHDQHGWPVRVEISYTTGRTTVSAATESVAFSRSTLRGTVCPRFLPLLPVAGAPIFARLCFDREHIQGREGGATEFV